MVTDMEPNKSPMVPTHSLLCQQPAKAELRNLLYTITTEETWCGWIGHPSILHVLCRVTGMLDLIPVSQAKGKETPWTGGQSIIGMTHILSPTFGQISVFGLWGNHSTQRENIETPYRKVSWLSIDLSWWGNSATHYATMLGHSTLDALFYFWCNMLVDILR